MRIYGLSVHYGVITRAYIAGPTLVLPMVTVAPRLAKVRIGVLL
jgi:hypothetical protein